MKQRIEYVPYILETEYGQRCVVRTLREAGYDSNNVTKVVKYSSVEF